MFDYHEKKSTTTNFWQRFQVMSWPTGHVPTVIQSEPDSSSFKRLGFEILRVLTVIVGYWDSIHCCWCCCDMVASIHSRRSPSLLLLLSTTGWWWGFTVLGKLNSTVSVGELHSRKVRGSKCWKGAWKDDKVNILTWPDVSNERNGKRVCEMFSFDNGIAARLVFAHAFMNKI